VQFIHGDIRDGGLLRRVLREHAITSVIHLAGLKAVGESVAMPLAYYDNNVVGTLRLAEAMNDCGVHSLVFSSSCTVYGTPQTLPLTETHPLCAVNPYGQTKLTIELMLRDLARSDDRWRICLLRYFNPVGAHDSGLIGEDPNGIPNNLMPFVLKVAAGEFKELGVWGSDYPTHDGTGVAASLVGRLSCLTPRRSASPAPSPSCSPDPPDSPPRSRRSCAAHPSSPAPCRWRLR
jgi:UDP-glucose 4-epimerase